MKKQLLLICIILIMVGIIVGFLVYQSTNKILDNSNPYDFTPSITQGIYGTAVECHGSEMPPSKGEWNTVKINFKIKNMETNETFEITTEDNGRYEYALEEGTYMIIVPVVGEEIDYAEIHIEKDSLIKRNIVTKPCPV